MFREIGSLYSVARSFILSAQTCKDDVIMASSYNQRGEINALNRLPPEEPRGVDFRRHFIRTTVENIFLRFGLSAC